MINISSKTRFRDRIHSETDHEFIQPSNSKRISYYDIYLYLYISI